MAHGEMRFEQWLQIVLAISVENDGMLVTCVAKQSLKSRSVVARSLVCFPKWHTSILKWNQYLLLMGSEGLISDQKQALAGSNGNRGDQKH